MSLERKYVWHFWIITVTHNSTSSIPYEWLKYLHASLITWPLPPSPPSLRLIILSTSDHSKLHRYHGRGASIDLSMWIALNNIMSVDMTNKSLVCLGCPYSIETLKLFSVIISSSHASRVLFWYQGGSKFMQVLIIAGLSNLLLEVEIGLGHSRAQWYVYVQGSFQANIKAKWVGVVWGGVSHHINWFHSLTKV